MLSNRAERTVSRPLFLESFPSFGTDDQAALRQLIRRALAPNCVMLEVGSWLGTGSTRVFIEELSRVSGSRLICVDTWKGSPNVTRHLEIVRNYDVFSTFRHNAERMGAGDFVHPMMMPSQVAASIVGNRCLDLVFIDGDHSYASTRADIAGWLPKVRPGGILAGHDCECRPVGDLATAISTARDDDHIPGSGTPFAAIHPGVIMAVHEQFHGKAHLWADEPLHREDGTTGRATLWDIVVETAP